MPISFPKSPQQWLAWHDRVGASIKASQSLVENLQAVTAAAVATVPGTFSASVTRRVGGRYRTSAYTGAAARDADLAQYELGQGPCVHAATDHTVGQSADLGAEWRWPELGRRTRALGVHSVVSIPMAIDPSHGSPAGEDDNDGGAGDGSFGADDAPGGDGGAALNFYGDTPNTFDDQAGILAALLASHAAALITAASHAAKVSNLRIALDTNREIGMAVGVLMSRLHLSRDGAFALLRVASQDSHRKLREVAAEVADTGTLDVPATVRLRPARQGSQ